MVGGGRRRRYRYSGGGGHQLRWLSIVVAVAMTGLFSIDRGGGYRNGRRRGY